MTSKCDVVVAVLVGQIDVANVTAYALELERQATTVLITGACRWWVGDIIIDGDDIFGDGVNIAARMQEIAPPGGLSVTGRMHDDVCDRLDTVFEDAGVQP